MIAALMLASAAFVPVPAEDAVAYFRHICVDTLPEPRAFATALAAEPPGWVRFEKNRRGTPVIGHFWRSSRGELSYLNLPDARFGDTNPACHFAFRTDAAFTHEAAATALRRALGLASGQNSGTRRAPQTRWEARLANGLRVRIFLSSAVDDMDGPAARLSISAYRDPRRGD